MKDYEDVMENMLKEEMEAMGGGPADDEAMK